jgi:hypothetical protein
MLHRLLLEFQVEVFGDADEALRDADPEQAIVGEPQLAVQPDIARLVRGQHAAEADDGPARIPPAVIGQRRCRRKQDKQGGGKQGRRDERPSEKLHR